MKLTTSALLTSVVLASTLVSASPISSRHHSHGHKKGTGKGHKKGAAAAGAGAAAAAAGAAAAGANATGSSASAGAVYFITNQPEGNQVVSTNIGSDGTLTFGQAFSTQGNGLHGVTDPNGPDPLFAQGAVKVSPAAQALIAVNPGSNTVSMFSIDPNDPSSLTLVGTPADSQGEFPMSLAFNKAGTMACVLNGGKVNGVGCFSVDAKQGLVAMANSVRPLGLNQTTPPAGPAGTTSHVIFSEDETKLIASVKGVPPTPGFLATWDIAADGTLSQNFTQSTPSAGGLLPFSMTVIPGKNAVLATDAGIGFDIFDFSKGSSASSSIVPIDGQGATCWSSFSKQTGNFYLTDIDTATVTEVNVDDNLKGSIVKQYPQGKGSGTIDNEIATIGGNDFMYVMGANATQIDVLALNAPGQAKGVQTFDLAAPAKAAGVTIDPFNLQGMTAFVKAA